MSYTEKLRELEEQELTPAETEEAAFNKLLGYNLAAMREKRGLMQKQLADLMGVSQATWSRIEQGETRLTVYDLVMAGKVLNRRPQDLLPS